MIVKLAFRAVLIPNTEHIGPGKNILYQLPNNFENYSDEQRAKWLNSVRSHKGISNAYLAASLAPAIGTALHYGMKGAIIGSVASGGIYGLGQLHEHLRTKQRQNHIRKEIDAKRIIDIDEG